MGEERKGVNGSVDGGGAGNGKPLRPPDPTSWVLYTLVSNLTRHSSLPAIVALTLMHI